MTGNQENNSKINALLTHWGDLSVSVSKPEKQPNEYKRREPGLDF
jgi:hypothetical protein